MTQEKVLFYSEKDKWGELSNFWPLETRLIFEGQEYPTSEHLYQARKWIYSGCPAVNLLLVDEIRQCSTPYKAKILAGGRTSGRYAWQRSLVERLQRHRESGVVPDPRWTDETHRVAVMKQVLELKFANDSHCRRVLLSTSPRGLVERSSADGFWGDRGNGTGTNWLGILLENLRNELLLKEENPTITE